MTLPVLKARDIAHGTLDEVRGVPLKHLIEFDDGEQLEAWQNETIYSYLFWDLFHPYPTARILKQHHIQTVLRGEALNTDSHRMLCSAILKSIVQDAQLFRPEQKEPLLAGIYNSISFAQGALSMLCEADVVSIDILDFVQIARHPKIEALRQAAMEDPGRIKYTYEETIRIIEHEPAFLENGLAKAVRSKMVKANQVVQCVVFRGVATEVDGTIFPKPIWSNYTFGMRKFYDFMADSRLAAKSHFYSDTALKDSEYTARRFQFFAMPLERIVYEDCGTSKHTTWMVKGPVMDATGTVTYPGDLPNMIGKHYLEGPDDTVYKTIQGNEKHLIGKMIRLRTLLGCQTPDPHAVCHVCAGELSQNVSRFSNLGHLGSVSTTKEFTQNILSIKHVNMSSVVLKVLLGDHERQFMNTGPDGSAFFLNASLKELQPTLTVIRDEAPGLIDLQAIDDIGQISLPRISATNKVMLTTTAKQSKSKEGPRYENTLDVAQKTKTSMLSREMLIHLKKVGWSVDDRNNFVFDMSDWDFSQPILVMMNKEESFVDLANQANVLVQSSQKMIKKRHQDNAPELLLSELFDLVNSKLRVNIVALEMIVYPLMVKSKTSYEMGRGSPEAVLGIAELLTKFRSLGPTLAYEDQHMTLMNPVNFYPGKRPDSPMDVFMAPREVVATYQRLDLPHNL